jgi:hypothetical protein
LRTVLTKLPRLTAAVLAAGFAAAATAQGGGPSLAMLDRIEAGRWEIRLREPGSPSERICIPNGRRLIQLRHPDATCERFVIQDGANDVVVQYTCRGKGYGRTHIRRETGRLVQIDSQGIAQGLPFEFSAEARRVGDCTGA